jgi:nickel transport protein
MKINKIYIIAFILLILPFNNALAHKVIVFAWVESGMIFSEAKFASKRKVKNSPVIVIDGKGIIVHKGMTDDEGKYSFKIPENIDSDLIVKIKAGEAHQGQWQINKNEILQPVTSDDIKASMKEKERLEKSPSIIKIVSGIFVIFILAFGLKFFKRKRT